MISVVPSKPTESFVFTSSVRDDVWHPRSDPKAYEWWHFDALSDNGREAILVTFLDNFIYSPRYNRASTETPDAKDSVHLTRFPAIAFTYFCEGTALYRTTVEYDESEMTASSDRPAVTIGNSFFRYEEADYGSGFTVVVNEELSRGRRIEAHLEWLSIESDLRSEGPPGDGRKHCWNMVAPRSDVTGKITIIGKNGNPSDVRHFRGTGYHDHKLDNRWLADTVRDWNWGRAHFADATAVFCRYRELGDAAPVSKLLIVRNGELLERSVEYEEQNFLRDKFGIRYPTRLRLISDDNMRLRIKPSKIIHSSFYFLRFLSEFTLTLRDGIPRRTLGISEFVAPRALKLRWINWLRRA
jgi:hypothetical protein